MRRAIARGRVFPQSYSTDRRYGRLSLKACALFPLMWSNADDQGRLCGDPEEVKYSCCPNIDHITKADIPGLLNELEQNNLIKVYDSTRSRAIQLIDWWDIQRPQWAWPSQYPPSDGWTDHLRYKRGAKEVVKVNWDFSGDTPDGSQVSTAVLSGEFSPETSPGGSPAPSLERETETERGKRKEERGNSPEGSGENSGEKPPPSSPTKIYDQFVQCFEKGWGQKTDGKSLAQLRDYSYELARAGCPESYVHEAFKEAACLNKCSLSYVRVILLNWLGVPRETRTMSESP